ncbi:MAG: hypothetical protein CSA62_08655 [Planctomycetota bacterium]|nr:MAG: hypothetical protein CSA62_08655 [Planctomycetota bacterium]
MAENKLPSGRTIRECILQLSSPKGVQRLAAVTELIAEGEALLPAIVDEMQGEESELMRTPWGEALLQIVYAQHWEAHRELLQEAFFQGYARVHRNHFEMRPGDSLGFLCMCLNAPEWKVREEAAHTLMAIGAAAQAVLPQLHSAAEAEEHEEAKKTMQLALSKIQAACAGQ